MLVGSAWSVVGPGSVGGEGTAVAAAGTGGIVLEQMVPVHVGCNPTV